MVLWWTVFDALISVTHVRSFLNGYTLSIFIQADVN